MKNKYSPITDVNAVETAAPWLKLAVLKNAHIKTTDGGEIVFVSGTWKSGTWEDGTWENGTWKNGTWENGTWKNGTWEDGWIQTGRCRWLVFYNSKEKLVRVGCKQKTIQEWDAFFASEETYETPRGTDRFDRIEKTYRLAKMAVEMESAEIEKRTGENNV
jgi:hypothetical protein